jgi:DNA-binding beta-propeller fold protein YncE
MNIRRTIILLALATIATLSHAPIAPASIGVIGSFGTSGPGQLNDAEGITVDPSTGDVYVVDTGDQRVVKYDQFGTFILTFGLDVNRTKTLKGGATEAETNICTATEIADEGVECQDGLPGSETGQFEMPTGVAVDPNTGDVYVSDGGNNRVERFTARGVYLSQIVSGQDGAPSFKINVPSQNRSTGNDSWVDSESNLYLVQREFFGGSVYKFDSAGEYTGEAFNSEGGERAAVVVNSDGRVYVSGRTRADAIVEFEPNGMEFGMLGVSPKYASCVAPGEPLAINLYTGEVFDTGRGGDEPSCYGVTRVYGTSGQQLAELPASDDGAQEEHEPGPVALAYGTAAGRLYELTGHVSAPPGELVEVVIRGMFPTPPQAAPTVTDEDWSVLGFTSVTLSAKVTPHLVDTTYRMEYGTDSGLAGARSIPVSAQDVGSSFLPVNVSQELTGLSQSTTYYYRVAAHSAFGGGAGSTVEGPIQSFTTLAPPPSVTTEGAREVSSDAASVSGTVVPGSNGAASDTKWCFQYGTTEAPGYNLGFAPGAPTGDAGQGTSPVPVSVHLTRLTAGTTYRYRLVAVNSLGSRLSSTACGTEGGHETDGAEGTFTTSSTGRGPLAVSEPAALVSQNAATLMGTVDPQGARTIYYFQIGTDASYGVDLFGEAGAGSEPEPVSVVASGLQPGTTYHCRLVASNANGMSYGVDESFTTPTFPSSVLSAPVAPSLLVGPSIVFPSEPVASKTKVKKTKKSKTKSKKSKKRKSTNSRMHKRSLI